MKKLSKESCGQQKQNCCQKEQGQFKTLSGIVAAYIRCNRPVLEKDLAYYKDSGTWARAVERAARAERHNGKMHPHQWHIGRENMAKVKEPLLRLSRRKFVDFDVLHDVVNETIDHMKSIGQIEGIGPLTIYDTALRLGAFRGVLPDRVYLHAGTLKGVKNLGLIVGTKKSLAMSELPEFGELEAYEVENCLCIYKDAFKSLENRPTT